MQNQQQMPPVAVDVETAMRCLSLKRTAFYGAIKRGDIRVVKLGRRTLVPWSELERVVSPGRNMADVAGTK